MTYDEHNITVGMRVMLTGETTWTTVTNVPALDDDGTTIPGCFDGTDESGDEYTIMFDMIAQVDTPTPTVKVNANADAVQIEATRSAVQVPDWMETAVLKAQENLRVKPGVIVTYSNSLKYGLPADRLWVVLAFTKNSKEQAVNIAPVNGDPAFNSAWLRCQVGNCTPVKFRALVHPRGLK